MTRLPAGSRSTCSASAASVRRCSGNSTPNGTPWRGRESISSCGAWPAPASCTLGRAAAGASTPAPRATPRAGGPRSSAAANRPTWTACWNTSARRRPAAGAPCSSMSRPTVRWPPSTIVRSPRGAAVASANKLPFAGPIEDFRAFRPASAQNVFHEATVGAGLPVLHTADMLLGAGDRIDSISGVFSGTLAYLTGKLGAGSVWSEAVREAHGLGYTEPDPRDDLGGLDVARKLLILARICGCGLDLEDIEVEPMLDRPDLADLPLEAWWKRLVEADVSMAGRFADAASSGPRTRLPGRTGHDRRFGHGPGRTARRPLRPSGRGDARLGQHVRLQQPALPGTPPGRPGPGAGADLTAGGVFADILRAWAQRGSAR